VADAMAVASERTPVAVLAAIDRVARAQARLITAAAARWRDDTIDVAWIGDVRAHLIRGARAVASTRDHTVASERGLVDAPPVLARAASRALGGPDARWDQISWRTAADDVLLLCGPDLHDFTAPATYLARALDPGGPPLGRVAVGRRS
jgi:serine/threonine protein phosphatase PrpC